VGAGVRAACVQPCSARRTRKVSRVAASRCGAEEVPRRACAPKWPKCPQPMREAVKAAGVRTTEGGRKGSSSAARKKAQPGGSRQARQ